PAVRIDERARSRERTHERDARGPRAERSARGVSLHALSRGRCPGGPPRRAGGVEGDDSGREQRGGMNVRPDRRDRGEGEARREGVAPRAAGRGGPGSWEGREEEGGGEEGAGAG